MENVNKKLLFTTITALIVSVVLTCLLLFDNDNGERVIVKTETVSDTVTIEKCDTIFKEVQKTIVKPVKVKEQIIEYDTIQIEPSQTHLNVPITASTYQDSITLTDSTKVSYIANISGYNANLDTISFKVDYPTINHNVYTGVTTTTMTEKEIIKYKKPKITFGLGVGAGYGIINKKPDIFIGGTLQIPIFSK